MFTNMQYVYEVYKAKSFSKAAEKLYISQPSLSATVKKVESRVGSPIFDRSTNPIKLTECGAEYISCVERIMDIKSGFENYLSDLGGLRSGRLSIGASNFFVSYALPPALTRFKRLYPQVEVKIVESNTAQLEKLLISGDIDLMVDNNDLSDSIIKKQVFFREWIILAVPKAFDSNKKAEKYKLSYADIEADHHLDDRVPEVDLKLFSREPFIMISDGNDSRDRADALCASAGMSPRIILELDQLATAFHVCCQGMGATFVSDSLVKAVKNADNVFYYRFKNPAARRRNLFYYKRSKYITRAMKEFLSIAAPETLGEEP